MTKPATLSRRTIPLVIAAALLGACALGSQPTTTSGGTIKANLPGFMDSRAAQALAMGLAAGDSFVDGTMIQVKAPDGQPLADATLTIGEERFTTDRRGVVVLPDGLRGDVVLAAVERPGYVGVSATLLTGAAIKLVPVDPNRTAIGPAGGTARNAANNLEVVFPPGSVVSQGNIAVTRSYSDTLMAGSEYASAETFTDYNPDKPDEIMKVDIGKMPSAGHYKYNLDLGGTTLAPGSQISVRFKAEGDMKKMLEQRLAKGDDLSTLPDMVSRDASGDLWLTMAVKGPEAAGAAAPVAAEAPKLYSLNSVSCETYYDERQADVEANNRQGVSCYANLVPEWQANFNARGYSQVATVMTHDGRFNGGGCIYYHYDPAIYFCVSGGQWGNWYQRTDRIWRRWYTSSIMAKVMWSSDDSRLANQAVPGARVSFNHSQVPFRTSAMVVDTDGDGEAKALGQQGSSGVASATLASQPWVYGAFSSYNVDCRKLDLRLVKNMPRVRVTNAINGTAVGATAAYPTNLGVFNASTNNPTLTPTIPLDSATASFKISGSAQPDATTWLDQESTALTIGWNQNQPLGNSMWYSKQIGVQPSYTSNDGAVAADQQPATKWSGQAATGLSITFNHNVSGYASKPSNRDQLTFTNAGQASTWGLNGSNGAVTATRTNGAVSVAGTASYTIAGQTVALGLNANLPEIRMKINGASGLNLLMRYTLTRSDGQGADIKIMNLPAPSPDGYIHFFLPVEEAVGTPFAHAFKVISIAGDSFIVQMPVPTQDFPVVGNQFRGSSTAYPVEFGTTTAAPK